MLSRSRLLLGCWAAAMALAAVAAPAHAVLYTFDAPVVTGAQAPGVWYTDRYAPAGFSSPDFFADTRRATVMIASLSAIG